MSTNPNHKPAAQMYCATCENTFESGDRCPDDGTRLVRIKAHTDPLLGRELDGRYTIAEKLGQGGMGSVYRATQHTVGRDVAVKVVNPALISDPDVIKRFLREAKLASKLSHPNAVNVLEFGQTDDGLLYLVMELVTGRTLDQVIKIERTFTPERIVHIGAQVCDALEGAHALQIVHRDMKPANIMLLAQGRDLVKVLDFGLAKSIAPDQTSTTMTNAGGILGTPAYMPPELALGQPCDGRADLYSLGCVLFLLGAGRLPFVSDNAHELIAMHGTEPAPPMMGVPPALAAVIDRMLEKNPANRYQSAAENREALETALAADRALAARHADPGDMPVATALGIGPDQPLATEIGVGPFPHTVPQFASLKTEATGARATALSVAPRQVEVSRSEASRASSDPLSRLPSPAEVSKQRRAIAVSQSRPAVGDSLVPEAVEVSHAPTMLATSDIVPTQSIDHAEKSTMKDAPRGKRWLLPVLVLVVLAAGGAAFFALQSSSSSSQPATTPAPVVAPAAAPAAVPAPTPAADPAPVAPAPAPETAPVVPPTAAPAVAPEPEQAKPTPKPKPPTSRPRRPTTNPPTSPKPPPGSGSAKQPPALPF